MKRTCVVGAVGRFAVLCIRWLGAQPVRHSSGIRAGLLAAGTLVLFTATSPAATWDGGGADANWTTANNWAANTAPVSPEALSFGGTVQLTPNNDFAANTRFNGLTFLSDAGAFLLSGNAIDLGGNLVNSSANAQVIGLGLNLLQTTVFDLGTPALTVNAVIADGGSAYGVTKTGTGTLNLRRGNTYTGPTLVRHGLLSLDHNGTGAPQSNLISASSPLTLCGDGHNVQVTINGRNNLASVQSFNGVTFAAGLSTLPLSRTGTGSMTVGFGAVSRAAGACLGLTLPAAGSATVAAGTPLQNGILGGWATIGTDWLTHSGGTLAAYTSYTVLAGVNPTIASDATANVSFDATSSGTVGMAAGGVTDINTLRCPQAANRLVDIGAGNTLRLGTIGGVWRAHAVTASGVLTVTNGTLTAGGAANTDGDLVINTGGATGGSYTSHSNVAVRVYSAIANNGTGVVTLTKTGPQIAELRGVNTYTGPTYVLEGHLRVRGPTSLGTNDVYVFNEAGLASADHGMIALDAAGTYNNRFFLAGSGPITRTGTINDSYGALNFRVTGTTLTGKITLLGNATIATMNNVSATITGQITGAAGLSFFTPSYPTDTCNITLTNTGNDWTGNTTIQEGGTSGRTRILWAGAAGVIPNGTGKGDVVIHNTSTAATALTILALNGFDETINGLRSTGSNTAIGCRIVRNNTAAAATATFTLGDGDASGTFFGTITSGNAAAVLNLRKIGTGTQILSGTCTHTGTTAADGGTLEVSGTITATSAITANDNGTFAYTGATALDRAVTVAGGTFCHSSPANYSGALTFTDGRLSGTNWFGNLSGLAINTGHIVAPGRSIGKALTANQTWAGGGTLEVEINNATGAQGVNWDLMDATGALDISGLSPATPFTVKLLGLDGTGAAGAIANFNAQTSYQWPIVTFSSLSGAFNSASFDVDVTGFTNPYNGIFKVVQSGNTLAIQYTKTAGTIITIR